METNYNDKPLMMMNEGELLQLAIKIAKAVAETGGVEVATMRMPYEQKPKQVAIGWTGLAKVLGVTAATAKARYETGALDKACKMVDGKLVTDVERAVLAWAEYKRSQRGQEL